MKLRELFETVQFERDDDYIKVVDLDTHASAKFTEEGDNMMLATSFETPKSSRGKGGATAVMCAIIKHADEYGLKIRLNVLPDEDINQNWLIKFYEKFGFKITKLPQMIREPK